MKMYPRREKDTGPSDKGDTAMKDSEEKEKEEKAKSGDISEEKNPSSTSNPPSEEEEVPPAAAAEKLESEKKNVRSSGEENPDSPPSKKQKQTDSSEDQTQNQTPQAKSGDSSEGARQDEVRPEAVGNDVDDDDDWPDDDNDWPEDIFLFEIRVPIDEILTIPAVIAAEHFPTLSARVTDPEQEQILQLTDFTGYEWMVALKYHKEEETFINEKEWKEISNRYNLNDSFTIMFYKPVPRLHDAHYLIEFDRREEFEVFVPDFRANDFLFEIKLDWGDINFARLFLPADEVHMHFPAIRLPEKSQKELTMKFTDGQSKNWYMEVFRYTSESYMIIKWWDEFVKNHDLKVMDVIRFYRPEHPSHRKHFLIQIVKDVDEANLNQPDGGPGGNGASTSDSNYKRKGKAIAYG